MADDGYVLNLRTEEAQKEADDAIYAAEYEQMDKTAADAAALSPRRTGTNAASIIARLRRTDKGTKGTIASTSGYGGWIEIGARNIPPRPYIYPAAVKDLGEIVDNVRVRISKR